MPKTQAAKDTIELMERGDISKMSFGFYVDKDKGGKHKAGRHCRAERHGDGEGDVSSAPKREEVARRPAGAAADENDADGRQLVQIGRPAQEKRRKRHPTKLRCHAADHSQRLAEGFLEPGNRRLRA